MKGVCGAVVHIVLGSPWPNGNAMDGPVNNFNSGAVQIQSRFPFLRAGVKKCNRQTLGISLRCPPQRGVWTQLAPKLLILFFYFFGVRRCQQVV